MRRVIAIISIISLLLPTIAIAETAKGKTIRVESYTGEITVLSGTDKEVTVTEKMRIFNGYKIETGVSSYVYLSLDDTKAIKLDQNTEILVKKSWFSNKIVVKSGTIFFNVTAPLKDNENLDLVTSTMSMGIRGTSGTLAIQNGISVGQLYTGKSRVTGRKKLVDVKAGEMVISENIGEFVNKLEVVKLNSDGSEIPSFGLEEINSNPDLKDDIQQQSLLNTENFENQELLNKEKEEQRIKEEQEKQKILEQEARKQQLENKKSNTSNSSVTGKSSGGGGGRPALSWAQLKEWLNSYQGLDCVYQVTDYMKDYDTGMNTSVYNTLSLEGKEIFDRELYRRLESRLGGMDYSISELILACEDEETKDGMENFVVNINDALNNFVCITGTYNVKENTDLSGKTIFLNNATVTIYSGTTLKLDNSTIYATGLTIVNNNGGNMTADEDVNVYLDSPIENYRFTQGNCFGSGRVNVHLDGDLIDYSLNDGRIYSLLLN